MPSFDLKLKIVTTSKFGLAEDRTKGALTADQRVARTGIILSPGMVDVGKAQAGATTHWYAWDLASTGISGYRRLRSVRVGLDASIDTTFTYPPLEQHAIEEFATQAADLAGVQVRNSTMPFRIETLHTDTTDRNCEVTVDIYHRTSGGTETLLATYVEQVVRGFTANVWQVFTEDVTLNTQFGPSERLVIKYSGEDKGVPA